MALDILHRLDCTQFNNRLRSPKSPDFGKVRPLITFNVHDLYRLNYAPLRAKINM
jgi:hypothetical protein